QALEEEAFPFEEKAIEVHVKNLESLQAGVLNPWTEKSLAKLAELMPGRYAKNEMSGGFLDQIDTYAYRSPIPNAGPEMDEAEAADPTEPVKTTRLDPHAGEGGDHDNP